MIARATDRACRWLVENSAARRFYLFSAGDSEKHASSSLFLGGKGKKVVAGVRLPARDVDFVAQQRVFGSQSRVAIDQLEGGFAGSHPATATGWRKRSTDCQTITPLSVTKPTELRTLALR